MTRFEEIICSSETARAFMSVCDLGRTGFVGWLYDWQTLIAGGLAIGAAAVTTCFLICQTKLLAQQNRNQRKAITNERRKEIREAERQRKLALIPVSHALSEIDDYLKASFEAWENNKPKERPESPSDALRIIFQAAPYVDLESFESFRQLIVESQTFESRYSRQKDLRLTDILPRMIADIGTYKYLTDRLYNYARFEKGHHSIPYNEPTYADLHSSIFMYIRLRKTTDPVHLRIKEGLDKRFNRWKRPASE
ncbi:hypothetical protein [Brucella gallinifaecis]|uniref:hypothetical protein n=1 Tax=Brucella gallinifaecis TaxID=215590 RepID=UPI00235F5C68|nr:hypothetical protein [Brucella gallinifaecis]